MKKGESIKIFMDPITRTQKEGTAKLIHKVSEHPVDDEYKLERWQVRFSGGDNRLFTRTIRVDLPQATPVLTNVFQDFNKIFSGGMK